MVSFMFMLIKGFIELQVLDIVGHVVVDCEVVVCVFVGCVVDVFVV